MSEGGPAESGQNPGFDWAAATRDLLGFDTTTPAMARLWNFWGHGKDHFPSDREFGQRVEAACPKVVEVARYRTTFRARAVRALVGDHSIGQLLVVGTDLPLRDEVHEVAQQIDPMVRVVYADTDPMVLAHARGRLNSYLGSCADIDAGLEDPAALLAQAAEFLDLAEPIGVLLINSLDGLDDGAATHAVSVLQGALSPGSCIAICHLTGAVGQCLADLGAVQPSRIAGLPRPRNPAAVRTLFTGLEMVAPGVVTASRWRPEPCPWPLDMVDLWCGLGRIRSPLPERRLR